MPSNLSPPHAALPFRLPTRVFLGGGSLARLPEVVETIEARLPPARSKAAGSPRRWVLVVDPGLVATPWPERARGLLTGSGRDAVVFSEVEPNPRVETVERLAERLRAEAAVGVVGLGGGSVLDTAKAAAMLAANGGELSAYEGKNRFTRRPLPCLAIPTTCGTGSEVTWVSVITVQERRTKISIKGDGMFPDVALVDPEMLRTLPAGLVATTGADALTHALEAITGRPANPASDALATRAVQLLCGFLRRAVADIEGDAEAREAVMTASTLAGMAFGNADVGAVHCLSEALGGFYDVPHGLANAVLLEPVLRSHLHAPPGDAAPSGEVTLSPPLADRLAALELVVTGKPTSAPARERATRVLDAVGELACSIGVPSFASLSIPPAEYPALATAAVANGSNPSNPRPMGEKEYLEILHSLH